MRLLSLIFFLNNRLSYALLEFKNGKWIRWLSLGISKELFHFFIEVGASDESFAQGYCRFSSHLAFASY